MIPVFHISPGVCGGRYWFGSLSSLGTEFGLEDLCRSETDGLLDERPLRPQDEAVHRRTRSDDAPSPAFIRAGLTEPGCVRACVCVCVWVGGGWRGRGGWALFHGRHSWPGPGRRAWNSLFNGTAAQTAAGHRSRRLEGHTHFLDSFRQFAPSLSILNYRAFSR